MGDRSAGAHEARIWFWGLLALAIVLRVISFDAYI